MRGSDAVVRYGGDEFLVILADTSASDAHTVIDRINAHLKDWNKQGHLESFDLTVSIGCCEWTDGMTLDEALDKSDRAMYAEKGMTARSSGPRNPDVTPLVSSTTPPSR